MLCVWGYYPSGGGGGVSAGYAVQSNNRQHFEDGHNRWPKHVGGYMVHNAINLLTNMHMLFTYHILYFN